MSLILWDAAWGLWPKHFRNANDYQPCGIYRCSPWKGVSVSDEMGAGGNLLRGRRCWLCSQGWLPAGTWESWAIHGFKGKACICCFPAAGEGCACSCCDELGSCGGTGCAVMGLPWESSLWPQGPVPHSRPRFAATQQHLTSLALASLLWNRKSKITLKVL